MVETKIINKIKLPPIQLDLVNKDKFNKSATQDFMEYQISNEEYMRQIVDKVKENNSQLCVTGNAFNKLF